MSGKAALYVDGFNFYYGVTNHFRPFRERLGYSLSGLCWCDFRALVERNFGHTQLTAVKYFTAPVTTQVARGEYPGEEGRYALWRAALATIPGIRVIEGRYQPRGAECPIPGAPSHFREEKQSDVQLAIEMVIDAWEHGSNLEIQYLLTGDQDLWPAVWSCILRAPQPMEVRILLPPNVKKATALQQLQDCAARLAARQKAGERVLRRIESKLQLYELDEHWLVNALLPYEPAPGVSCPHYWRLHPAFLIKCCKPKYRPDRPRLT